MRARRVERASVRDPKTPASATRFHRGIALRTNTVLMSLRSRLPRVPRALALALAALAVPPAAGCGDSPAQVGAREGASARGLSLFMAQGCITCHSSNTIQGPYLEGIGDAYLADAGGDVFRAKARVKAYVKDPRGVKPLAPRNNPAYSQMPAYPLMDEAQLEAIAEYILSIRDGRKP
jgi:mono/diheme cytochrome c family protein